MLTLRNANIKSSLSWANGSLSYNDGIVSATKTALNIKLVGTNSITVPYGSDASLSHGIVSYNTSLSDFADITISGSGKLTVKAAKAAYYSNGVAASKLTVKGKAKLASSGRAATDKSYARYGGYGFNVTGKMLITGNAKVVATGGKAAFYTEEGRVVPTYKKYIPHVKAGASSKSIKVNKKKPAKSIYKKYKYVSITKAQGQLYLRRHTLFVASRLTSRSPSLLRRRRSGHMRTRCTCPSSGPSPSPWASP